RDLGPLGADAPAKAIATDAWILEQDNPPLDPRVDAFLNAHPAPVYIGFGSMVAKKVPDLAAAAVAAVRAVGRAAIVAGGWAGRVEAAVEDSRFHARARALAPAVRARNGAAAAAEQLERLTLG